jgi:hypothetical protein
MQDDINAFLTARMEEEKVAAAAANGNVKSVDDAKAEENYGEEETVEE